MAVTQYCFEWQNAHHIPDMPLRDACISMWFLSSFGVIVLQLVCIVVGSFALVVLLTNPWVLILYIVMSGGTLS
jgi:hypothetical protein